MWEWLAFAFVVIIAVAILSISPDWWSGKRGKFTPKST